MGHVDRDPETVHAFDRAETELGEAAVARLAQARAQRVGLAVRDADAADAEAVEDVEAVDLVLDRRGRLDARHEGDPAARLRGADLRYGPGAHHHVLVREVRQAHAEVEHDVVPLPPGTRRDRRRAAHERVEHAVEAGHGQTLVARPLPPVAAVLRHLGNVRGRLGRAIALELARAGAAVGIIDTRPEAAGAVAGAIEGQRGRAATATGDVSIPADVDRALDALERSLGPADVLVNAHGIFPNRP